MFRYQQVKCALAKVCLNLHKLGELTWPEHGSTLIVGILNVFEGPVAESEQL